ncbi:MAG: type I-C CRISPR-associated protein Cas5 [Rhodobacteraceae bacterium]|nr:type I-C CRISPR-associated protein Cas5 [Paracoccaceae bacterium]
MAYGIRLHVFGQHGLFTRPEMKVERVSYDVMTPSAARGILEAIHWKPAIVWRIDRIHVLNPIRFQSIRRNEVKSKASTHNIEKAMKTKSLEGLQLLVDKEREQRAATVLVKPRYLIEAHFDLKPHADASDSAGKHLDIFNRRAERGQCFHQPCLGTREFAAHFELIPPDAPLPDRDKNTINIEHGFGTERDLGFMLWDIDHAAPNHPSLFWRAKLRDGVMEVPAANSPEVLR